MVCFGIYRVKTSQEGIGEVIVITATCLTALFIYILIKLLPTYNYIAVFLFLTLIALIGLSVFEVEQTENGKYKGTIIKTTDNTYLSIETSFFVGKTEKYLFIFNKKDTTTFILPAESVKSILIKENK